MIIVMPFDNSIVKWKNDDKDEWKYAEISDLINVYERQKGDWIIKPKENSQSAILICNKCNHFIPITIDKNYCPNCGADMRGKK